ncbi:MAG: UbiA family prenyltransferase [Flavobacteriales bacterium]|nr:UbiA family prenyltransferase [Flavobacteriales bacterium]
MEWYPSPALAGTLLTGASNALNQVLEVGEDALMLRTVERPLVRRALTTNEAVLSAFVAGGPERPSCGWSSGPLTGILGFISLFMYVALYTPLKKHSPWAVFVGAFPGPSRPCSGMWLPRASSASVLDCCSPCSSCGSSLISGPSHGCLTRTMHVRVSA